MFNLFKLLKLPKLPWFETHRPGMSILFLFILSIIYGLLGNIASMEVIIFITFFVYISVLIIYVDHISKEANGPNRKSNGPNRKSDDPNWYLYSD